MKTFYKHVDAVKDYTRKWSKWLASDTISTSTWEAEDGLTIDSDSNDTTSATVWISGGTVGQDYCVTNTIVTAAGRTEAKSWVFKVFDCTTSGYEDYQ